MPASEGLPLLGRVLGTIVVIFVHLHLALPLSTLCRGLTILLLASWFLVLPVSLSNVERREYLKK